MPDFQIRRLHFRRGPAVEIPRNAIVVVVGPNNSGKSLTLRSIEDTVKNGDNKVRLVQKIEIEASGEDEAVVAYLERTFTQFAGGWSGWGLGQTNIDRGEALRCWAARGHGQGLQGLAGAFCLRADLESRLGITHPINNFDLGKQAPAHPLQELYANDSLEARVSDWFQEAFGMRLAVDRGRGSTITAMVGDIPKPQAGEDRVSASYLHRLRQLPEVIAQGDGVKSFLGSLFYLLMRRKLLLIDEPEAFLHPPQAYHLGALLARETPSDQQLFIATHSSDIVRALIDVAPARLKVLRIQRKGESSVVDDLGPEDLKEIWADPLLRFSNIFDGLFHQTVVICEADTDCRFYSAVLDANLNLARRPEPSMAVQRPDAMFVHCGGKHRISTVARALKRVGVATKVIADFDLLCPGSKLREVVEAVGGNWQSIEKPWAIVTAAIDQRSADLNANQVKLEIQAVISSVRGPLFPSEAAKRISETLKKTSPWGLAKTAGVHLLAGDARSAAQTVLSRLDEIGIHVVDCGEVERFVPAAGGHGTGWLADVLARDLEADADLEGARRFMSKVLPLKQTSTDCGAASVP
jgi:energy-coupling factor transporter ATP-binding protein EcfA2